MNSSEKTEKTYSIEDLQKIVKELRVETGCPWDRKQTHGSLTGCILDEAAETVSGINLYEKTGNPDSMKEELGDLLLQVIFHAEMAEEEGLFTLTDVISGISKKMIRRHPHVFEPDGTPLHGRTPDPVNIKSWEEIKAAEKAEQSFRESGRKKRLQKIFTQIFRKIL